MNWWERQEDSDQEPQFAYRAVAYYRHSAQDRQENSIAIQQDQVRSWAKSNGVEIIHEFMDSGKSGLTAEGRPGRCIWISANQKEGPSNRISLPTGP